MRFFFQYDFKISINTKKYIKTTKFEKTVSINAIKLNWFQRKAVKALDGSMRVMPRWDVKNVRH